MLKKEISHVFLSNDDWENLKAYRLLKNQPEIFLELKILKERQFIFSDY